MFNFKVHIYNEDNMMDENVYVNIRLPFLPPINSVIHLSDESVKQLEDMAKASLDIANRYAPRFFYGKSTNCYIVKKENLKDLSFSDAIYVKEIRFKENIDVIEFELYDNLDRI